ncbi:MAG: DUF6036 family nucleotidyltransferase [Thermoanaerobaculia bacterium]
MNRQQLEHVLRASASLSGCRELVVIGSQALLASFPDAPQVLLRSMEVDLYPLNDPGKADLIDGSIGELSPFHDLFGYYAHGVGPETAVLPSGWRDRWVKVETEGAVGWCLSPVDLAISKLAAGRAKDIDFVRGMLATRILDESRVNSALGELPFKTARAIGELWEICKQK